MWEVVEFLGCHVDAYLTLITEDAEDGSGPRDELSVVLDGECELGGFIGLGALCVDELDWGLWCFFGETGFAGAACIDFTVRMGPVQADLTVFLFPGWFLGGLCTGWKEQDAYEKHEEYYDTTNLVV